MFCGGRTKCISKVIQRCGSQELREWWGSSKSMVRWGRPGLEFCLISWPSVRGFPSPKGNLSFALSLMTFAKLGSDKNEVSLCLQSVLRFLGETLHNPSNTFYKCGLSCKACGPYLSTMPLIHWELDPGKKCTVLCVAHISQCFIQQKKIYKTTEMIFYLTDWELLVHADPSWCSLLRGNLQWAKHPRARGVFTYVVGALNASSENWGERVTCGSSYWQGR